MDTNLPTRAPFLEQIARIPKSTLDPDIALQYFLAAEQAANRLADVIAFVQKSISAMRTERKVFEHRRPA